MNANFNWRSNMQSIQIAYKIQVMDRLLSWPDIQGSQPIVLCLCRIFRGFAASSEIL